MVAGVWNRRTAEVMGQAPGVQHHLDDVGVLIIGQGVDGMGCGTHARLGPRGQQGRHGVDERRVHQGFVALHVDHHRITVQPKLRAGFCQPVAAAGVVGAREQGLHAVGLAGLQNARVVGGHHHACRSALCGAAGHMHHHGQAGDVGQGLVRQPARCHACRNQHREARCRGWAHACSSSSVRVRASFSSSTGIPSRTG